MLSKTTSLPPQDCCPSITTCFPLIGGKAVKIFLDTTMTDQFHIMIARDKGQIVRFLCTVKKLRILLSASIFVFLFLIITSIFSVSLFTENREISSNVVELQQKLQVNKKTISYHKKADETEKLRLRQQLNDLELNNAKQAVAFQADETEKLKLRQQLNDLELNNVKQAVAFQKEKELLISTAINELNERSKLIEKIMGTIGINLEEPKKQGTKNSGGPFIPQSETLHEDLLERADSYLKKIQYIPLGRPVQGRITSPFGKRKDPINRKNSFHSGIDFHGKRGEKIYATADGVVKKTVKHRSYGKYLLVNHGNGYTTSFAHLQTFLVKKGDRVKRGQPIALVGNTGRSTGPHLHYEINLDQKPINPHNFIKFANLLESNYISLGKK